MVKEKQFVILKWLSIFVFAVLISQSNLKNSFGQNTKQEKCEKLADCMESFYKDCYNEEFRNSFSPKLFDSFTSEDNEEIEMARLDQFLLWLTGDNIRNGYVVVYGGRTNKYGEYDIRVERVTGYIFGTKAQDKSRIKIVHGGFREKFEFELWISPIKNAFPPLSPTVAPEKVRFKGKMKPFGP